MISDLQLSIKATITRILFSIGDLLPEYKPLDSIPLCDGEPWLEIRPSLIPGAENGLFTTKAIRAGTAFCRYIGTPLSLFEMLRTRDRRYIYKFNFKSYLDSGPHSQVKGRYINHHFSPTCRNVKFAESEGEVWYVATRDISRGEELYANYGEFYWLTIDRKAISAAKAEF